MTRPVEQVVYIRGTEDEEHHPEHSNRYYINFPEIWRTISGRRLTIGVRNINYHRGYPEKVEETPALPSNPVPYYNFGFSFNVYFINENNKPIIPDEPFIYDIRYGAHRNKISFHGFANMERYGAITQWADQVKLWNDFLGRHVVDGIPSDKFQWVVSSESGYITCALSPVDGYEGTVPYFYNFFDYSWDDTWATVYYPLVCFSSFTFDYVNRLVNGHWYWFPTVSAHDRVNLDKTRKHRRCDVKLLIEDIRLVSGNGDKQSPITFNNITTDEPLIVNHSEGLTEFTPGLLEALTYAWGRWWNNPDVKTKLQDAGIADTDIADHQWRVDNTDPDIPIFYLDYDRANDSTKWYPQVRFQVHNIAGINLSHFQIRLYKRDPWQPRLHISVDKHEANPWGSTQYINTGDVVTEETAGLIPYSEIEEPTPQPTDTPCPTPQSTTIMLSPHSSLYSVAPELYPVDDFTFRQVTLQTYNAALTMLNTLVDMASREWRESPYRLLVNGVRNFNYTKHLINAIVSYNDKNGVEFGEPQRMTIDYTYPTTEEFSHTKLSTRFTKVLNGIMNRFRKVATKEGEDPPTDLEVITTKEGDTIRMAVVPTATPMTGSYPRFENIVNPDDILVVPLDAWTVTMQYYEHENGDRVELPVVSFKEPIPDGYVELESSYNLPTRNNDSGIDVAAVQPTESTSIPTSRNSATMAPTLTQEAVYETSFPTSKTSATIPTVLGPERVTMPRNTVYLNSSQVYSGASSQSSRTVQTTQVSNNLLVAASFVSQTKDQYLGFTNSEYCPMKMYDITTGETRFWIELYTADGKYGYELAKDGSEFITIELQLTSSI